MRVRHAVMKVRHQGRAVRYVREATEEDMYSSEGPASSAGA